jgi:hypothetical protein
LEQKKLSAAQDLDLDLAIVPDRVCDMLFAPDGADREMFFGDVAERGTGGM